MQFVRQFMIILAIPFVGELLHALLLLPVPASIYGPCSYADRFTDRYTSTNAVNEAGGFLIGNHANAFIPAGVGLLWFPGGCFKASHHSDQYYYRRYNHPCYGRKRTYCTVYL